MGLDESINAAVTWAMASLGAGCALQIYLRHEGYPLIARAGIQFAIAGVGAVCAPFSGVLGYLAAGAGLFGLAEGFLFDIAKLTKHILGPKGSLGLAITLILLPAIWLRFDIGYKLWLRKHQRQMREADAKRNNQ